MNQTSRTFQTFDMIMDRLESYDPTGACQSQATNKDTFEKYAQGKITINRGDLNKALFVGKHYSYQYGVGQKFEGQAEGLRSGIVITQRGRTIQISARLNNAQGQQDIELLFQTKNNICTLSAGTIAQNSDKESIVSPKRLGEVLHCIYKHVRMAADPKWALAYILETEAREVAAQPLDTGRLPHFIVDKGTIIYKAPRTGADKVCDGQCGKCALRM